MSRTATLVTAAIVFIIASACGVSEGGGTEDPPNCDEGQMRCGADCVDPLTDPEHCGGCGKACEEGEECVGATCRDAGGGSEDCREVPCTGFTYCDLNTGECLPGCASDSQCPPNEVCDRGIRDCVCDEGFERCGEGCVDVMEDSSHCGGCNQSCLPHQNCEEGECLDLCPAGTVVCGEECIDDVEENPLHCGGCNIVCRSDQYCEEGECRDLCPGETLCGEYCVDVNTDRSHCGDCGNTCEPDEVCVEGSCTSSCPGGGTVCDGVCVDTTTSDQHCGACGNACAYNESCIDSSCRLSSCSGGLTLCGQVCVDTDSDPDHCGGCNQQCPSGESCVGGECGDEPGYCVDYSVADHLKECEGDADCGSPFLCRTMSWLVVMDADDRCVHRTPCVTSPTQVCCREGHVCGKSDGMNATSDFFCCKPGEYVGGLTAVCTDAGATLGCGTSQDCPNEWGRPHCDTTRETPVCIPCSSDDHCPSDRFCDFSTGKCEACTNDSHCTSPENPYCAPDNSRCVACVSDSHCNDPDSPICTASYTCVQCTNHDHCTSSSEPYCRWNSCAECSQDSHCPSTARFCEQGTCMNCPLDFSCSQYSDGRWGCYPDTPPTSSNCTVDDDCTGERICGAPSGQLHRCSYTC